MKGWKLIEEHKSTKYIDKRYISNFGMIKNISNNGVEKIFNPAPNSRSRTRTNRIGYRGVRINGKFVKVHLLMGKYWITNPNPLIYDRIDHMDQNTLNNHYTKLVWTNRSGNQSNKSNTGKNKKGVIRKTIYNTYSFIHYINLVRYTKTFKTERDAKLAQYWYQQLISLLEF